MKEKLKNTFTLIGEFKVLIYVVLIVLIPTILSSLLFNKIPLLIHVGLYKDSSFWAGILGNLHNTLIDVLIFSIIVAIFTKKIETKQEIQKYLDSIDECRYLKTTETPYRILVSIKRLNHHKVTEINLTKCYVPNVHLIKADLTSSQMMGINLDNTNLKSSIMKKVNLKGGSLKEAQLRAVDFSEASMKNIKCNNTNFKGAILRNVDLCRAELIDSTFVGTDLRGADLKEVKFDNSVFYDANFKGAINIDIDNILKCKSLKKCKFDSAIKNQIEQIKPEILRK
ncbi:pentapeptide repeat-containing protein (plasmid) [Priestia megaterium]|uniref:pentapeptide repeat-containing protein n=1 Tax=Priestia megaterium TaxID=1404 RepID=UPI0038AD9D67